MGPDKLSAEQAHQLNAGAFIVGDQTQEEQHNVRDSSKLTAPANGYIISPLAYTSRHISWRDSMVIDCERACAGKPSEASRILRPRQQCERGSRRGARAAGMTQEQSRGTTNRTCTRGNRLSMDILTTKSQACCRWGWICLWLVASVLGSKRGDARLR